MSDLTQDQLSTAAQAASITLNDSNSTVDQKIAAIVDILRWQRLI